MSYNIHHANPPSKPGIIDINAIVKTIASQSPDIVALQEVDVNTKRSGNINQATLLAEKLNMEVFFAKAIDHDGGDYGVAILSKFKIEDTATLSLPSILSLKGEPRILAIATLILPHGKKIKFGSTHLDAQKAETNRLMQAKALVKIGKKQRYPFILAGDWNAKPTSETVKILDAFFTRTCQDCEFTIPVINPKSAIDFISFSNKTPFQIISHKVIPERYASDHLPIVSILRLKK
ncbi:MAG: endonuclease/exonuclease/phosphatase [Pedobacter sp.]|nr:MAG: endonuclease/exonuclease/phosphatase [Pedobacter sp.]